MQASGRGRRRIIEAHGIALAVMIGNEGIGTLGREVVCERAQHSERSDLEDRRTIFDDMAQVDNVASRAEDGREVFGIAQIVYIAAEDEVLSRINAARSGEHFGGRVVRLLSVRKDAVKACGVDVLRSVKAKACCTEREQPFGVVGERCSHVGFASSVIVADW